MFRYLGGFLYGRGSGRIIFRKCNSQSRQNAQETARDKLVNYFNKVAENPLPLGVGALVVGLLQWKRIKEREARKQSEDSAGDVRLADDWQVSCYRSLPLRHVSRLWGWVNDVDLPVWMRSRILSVYVRAFGCNLEEAECSDLTQYSNLGQFFRRRLRPGARDIDPVSELVSPCDGAVLHWGGLVDTNGQARVEQVKGVSYKLSHFLGEAPTLQMKEDGKTRLYQCVLYLAPGDYHCFHSPCDWTVNTRRHFPGELMSVSPGVVRRIQSLFCLNERVAYTGSWKHGFFSMTAVGATNVGSVKVGIDPELATNTRKWETDTFHQNVWSTGANISKGEYFGEFNLGSTIVLIFEAPEDFKFSFLEEAGLVKVGKSIKMIATS